MAPMLEVADLARGYRAGARSTPVLDGLSLTVEEHQLVCILGPSGCGKSTLLRCVAGLLPPDRGEVRLRGQPVHGVPEGLAVVFQDYGRSLMPWSSVQRNVEFGLHRDIDRDTRRRRAHEALRSVGLEPVARQRPGQLSGGMQQRVAIARALACRPALLLMDEPFASVDAQTRADLEDLLLRLRHEYAMTVLLVTHDIDESVYLGDRVIVLSATPTSVAADVTVDLPRDRHQITTRESETFVHLRSRAARYLRRPPEDIRGEGSPPSPTDGVKPAP